MSRLRNVLLAVTGLSPQVVTETLYALVSARTPWVPDEIQLVTTEEGAERARLSLLSRQPGWFHRLCEEYSLPPIHFSPSSIHILQDSAGAPLRDIRSNDDNARAADQIAERIQAVTAQPDTALHVSIGGGRKTMGFYAAYSLSLLGRPQDRLSHVLVTAPYEAHPDFYYPNRTSRIIFTPPPDSRPLDTAAATITLAEIPFVTLRRWLPPSLLKRPFSFQEAVEAAQRRLGPQQLVFNLRSQWVQTAGITVSLPPAELAFYSWFARRRAHNLPALPCPAEGAPETDYASGYLAEYALILGALDGYERTSRTLCAGMEKVFFLERKSRVHRALRAALGSPLASDFCINPTGRRPSTSFGLSLNPDTIHWTEPKP